MLYRILFVIVCGLAAYAWAADTVKAPQGIMTPAASTLSDSSPGWKCDVTIYDRPGWSAAWLNDVALLPNDEILIRLTANPEDSYYDDFYYESSDTVTVSSTDGGFTWRETSPDRFPPSPSNLMPDGSLINVDYVNSLPPEIETRRRQGLKDMGLEKLVDNQGWHICPESMAPELKELGYEVFEQHPAIPEGQVSTFVNRLRARRSIDGGATWSNCPITGAPDLGHGPVFWDDKFTRLADGTILKPFYGSELFKKDTEAYLARSTDQGQTWNVINIAAVPGISLNETALVSWPDGRIVAMIRTARRGGTHTIHSTVSDDAGLTWRPARDTQIKGLPLRLLHLQSGKILCTYCYRSVPGGIRACLSHDRGQTWDYQNEIILRDDVMANHWISPAGPMSVQLTDGSIFTAYTIMRIDKILPGDIITNTEFKVHREKYHCYLAASRYTENYVKPLPWSSPKTPTNPSTPPN